MTNTTSFIVIFIHRRIQPKMVPKISHSHHSECWEISQGLRWKTLKKHRILVDKANLWFSLKGAYLLSLSLRKAHLLSGRLGCKPESWAHLSKLRGERLKGRLPTCLMVKLNAESQNGPRQLKRRDHICAHEGLFRFAWCVGHCSIIWYMIHRSMKIHNCEAIISAITVQANKDRK